MLHFRSAGLWAARPSLRSALLTPRRPAPPRPPLPGTGSLSFPLPQRSPSQTQLCSSRELPRRRRRGQGGAYRVRRRGREGGSPARQPSFLSVHLAVRQDAAVEAAVRGLCSGRGGPRDRRREDRRRDPPRAPHHGREEAIREGGRGRRGPCLF